MSIFHNYASAGLWDVILNSIISPEELSEVDEISGKTLRQMITEYVFTLASQRQLAKGIPFVLKGLVDLNYPDRRHHLKWTLTESFKHYGFNLAKNQQWLELKTLIQANLIAPNATRRRITGRNESLASLLIEGVKTWLYERDFAFINDLILKGYVSINFSAFMSQKKKHVLLDYLLLAAKNNQWKLTMPLIKAGWCQASVFGDSRLGELMEMNRLASICADMALRRRDKAPLRFFTKYGLINIEEFAFSLAFRMHWGLVFDLIVEEGLDPNALFTDRDGTARSFLDIASNQKGTEVICFLLKYNYGAYFAEETKPFEASGSYATLTPQFSQVKGGSLKPVRVDEQQASPVKYGRLVPGSFPSC